MIVEEKKFNRYQSYHLVLICFPQTLNFWCAMSTGYQQTSNPVKGNFLTTLPLGSQPTTQSIIIF